MKIIVAWDHLWWWRNLWSGTISGKLRIINCIILKNTATKLDGFYFLHQIMQGYNSILWGSSSQVYFNNTLNHGYAVLWSSGIFLTHTTCINLNSDNNAQDGPNFNATNGSDWSIKFISTCRDAGIIPSPTVPNDYAGNPRIGPYDMGAYEVQYSRWTGTTDTDWATTTNWDKGVDTFSWNRGCYYSINRTAFKISDNFCSLILQSELAKL